LMSGIIQKIVNYPVRRFPDPVFEGIYDAFHMFVAVMLLMWAVAGCSYVVMFL
jgi:hypothetical protein